MVDEIVIRVRRLPYLFACASGLVFVIGGFAMAAEIRDPNIWKPALIAIVPGAFLVAVSLRPLMANAMLRADATGLALGGNRKMRWALVRSVSEVSNNTISLQIDPRGAFRFLTFGMWLRARLTGRVNIDLPRERVAAHIATRLDAMRNGTAGDDGSGFAGEANLPSARLVVR